MGKGDLRTKRGKIWRGTSGKYRPKQNKRVVVEQAAQDNTPQEQPEEQPEVQPEEQPEMQPEEQPEEQA